MNIGIVGYGKMGKEIEKIAIEQSHNIIFVANSTNELNESLKLKSIDVIIEFTNPTSSTTIDSNSFDELSKVTNSSLKEKKNTFLLCFTRLLIWRS